MRRWPRRRAALDTAELARARRKLAEARADEPRIAALVEAHERKQQDNHFGARMHQAFGGH